MKAAFHWSATLLSCLFVVPPLFAGVPSEVAVKLGMVVTGKSPYPLADRKDLSLNTGGGKGF
jgi:hypothetical protein